MDEAATFELSRRRSKRNEEWASSREWRGFRPSALGWAKKAAVRRPETFSARVSSPS